MSGGAPPQYKHLHDTSCIFIYTHIVRQQNAALRLIFADKQYSKATYKCVAFISHMRQQPHPRKYKRWRRLASSAATHSSHANVNKTFRIINSKGIRQLAVSFVSVRDGERVKRFFIRHLYTNTILFLVAARIRHNI